MCKWQAYEEVMGVFRMELIKLEEPNCFIREMDKEKEERRNQ